MADDVRPEYDFKSFGEAVRGRYAQADRDSSNVVRLDDVASAFPNEQALNDALRRLAKQQVHPDTPSPER